MFQTIQNNAVAEIIEKKSRFIAHVFYVESVIEAEKRIEDIRKQYKDARHNCYAYRVIEQEQTISKSSDDGEPSGTAGAPMLGILEKNNLSNVVVIVTRYFGGILLGTGGLVRAYSDATLTALKQENWIEKELGYEVEVTLEYSDVEKFKYFCKQNNIKIEKEEYFEKIKIILECNLKQSEIFLQKEIGSNIKLFKSKLLRRKYVKKRVEK